MGPEKYTLTTDRSTNLQRYFHLEQVEKEDPRGTFWTGSRRKRALNGSSDSSSSHIVNVRF